MKRHMKIATLIQCGARQPLGAVSVFDPVGVYFHIADDDQGVQLIFLGAMVDPERYAKALDMVVDTIGPLPQAPGGSKEAKQRYRDVPMVQAILRERM